MRKIYRIVSLCLTVVILLSVVSISKATAVSAAAQSIEIRTAEQLNAVREDLNASYILMANIDLSSISNWVPIGFGTEPFTGTFDGNGYIISNVNISLHHDTENLQTESADVGFFGYTNGATIKNLGVENAKYTITSGDFSSTHYSNVGGIAGTIQNTSIENCYFKGSINNNLGKNIFSRSAGIAAIGISSNVTNCYSHSDIYANAYNMNTMAAGLVAWLDSVTIDKCYVAGNVVGENTTGPCYVGGANSSGNANSIFGIILSYGGTVKNCAILLENISANSGTNNYINDIGNFSDQYNNIVLTFDSPEAKLQSTYENLGWDFQSVWRVDDSYPILKVFIDRHESSTQNGYSARKNGWSFRNSYDGFDYSDSYAIPIERYREVFGSKFIAAATIGKNIFGKDKFDSMMISNSWGGNCYGMSVTSVLFYLRLLDWNKYNNLYENDFQNANDYYYTVRGNKLTSAYTCSDKGTPITDLIEKYQILQYGTKRLTSNNEWLIKDSSFLYINEFFSENTVKDGNKTKAQIDINGQYVRKMLNMINDTSSPLIVAMYYNNALGKKVGHSMVIRTDIKPLNMGNGWYRIYVYDPNFPYYPQELLNAGEYKARNYYLDSNSDGTFIELNPVENKWRYYGAENGASKNDYHGCDANGNVKYTNWELPSIVNANIAPEYMYIFDISNCNYPTVFDGSDNYWEGASGNSTESTTIYTTGKSKFAIYSSAGNILCEIDSDDILVFDEVEYYPMLGEIIDVDSTNAGQIILPYKDFTLKYVSGDDISIIDGDSVINIACDGAATISISMNENKIDINSDTDNKVVTQITDVSFESGYTSVYVTGELTTDDEISLSLIDDNLLITSNIQGNSLLDVYTNNETDTEDKYVATVAANTESLNVPDVRNIVSVTDISVNPTSKLLTYYGESFDLIATILPNNASNKNVSFSSDNISVATVDAVSGLVTAVGEGTAVITAMTKDGNKTATCKVTVKISHEHKWTNLNASEDFMKAPATCISKAVYYKSCSICGEKSEETFECGDFDINNHVGDTYVKDQKEATCYEEGYAGDTYCSDCNAKLSSGTVIGKNEHTPASVWSTDADYHWKDCQTVGCGNIIDKAAHTGGEATCTKKAICSVCGVEYGTVNADNHKNTEIRNVVEATCMTDGCTGDTYCKDCGVKILDGAVIPAGHKLDKVDAKAASHEADGNIDYYICSVCGKLYKDANATVEIAKEDTVIAKGEHDYGDSYKTDAENHWKECGCGNIIEKSAHAFGDWAVTKEATATENGSKERICSVCGYKVTEVIPAMGTATDPTETTNPAESNKPSDTTEKSPQTGDTSNIALWIALMFISATGVVTMTTLNRKKRVK